MKAPLQRILLDLVYSMAASGRIVHLNHAGASPSPTAVVDRVIRHLHDEQRLGGYAAAAAVQDELEGVYRKIANLIHAEAESPASIALVESATVAWTRLFYAAAELRQVDKRRMKEGSDDRFILISEAEYAANVVAACQWARQHEGWNVLCIPSEHLDGCSTGKVDLQVLEEMLDGRYKYRGFDNNAPLVRLNPESIAMICITHVPTNSGIANPVYRIGRLIDEFNRRSSSDHEIFYLVDACQSVGQMDVDVGTMMCHGLVATGRKYLRGPRGTGFLYVSAPGSLMPHHIDHYSTPILKVPDNLKLQQPIQQLVSYEPRAGARRFEFWESNIANKLGLGCAVEVATTYGLDRIAATIQQRADYLYKKLQKLNNSPGREGLIRLHYRPESGIVTFWVNGIDSTILKAQMWNGEHDQVMFELSVVPATSTPMDSAMNCLPDLLRASVSYTTTIDEIDLFIARLDSLLEDGVCS